MSPRTSAQNLFVAIEAERSYLLRYAMAKLRDADAAEEAVQEALVAALGAVDSFQGDATLRTWLTSILKFKVIDYQRRAIVERERFSSAPAADPGEEADDWIDSLFDETGHWRAEFGTWALPDKAAEQKAFFAAFERCMDKLPPATARVFFQREVLGAETEEICKDECITPSNCWVILHRARLALRECLERNWFQK
jgi:RNA polymerase sigma-70 factor (ECF subfamily)